MNFHVGMRIGINRLNSAIYFCFFNQNDYKLHSRHGVASIVCLITAHECLFPEENINKMPGYWWHGRFNIIIIIIIITQNTMRLPFEILSDQFGPKKKG